MASGYQIAQNGVTQGHFVIRFIQVCRIVLLCLVCILFLHLISVIMTSVWLTSCSLSEKGQWCRSADASKMKKMCLMCTYIERACTALPLIWKLPNVHTCHLYSTLCALWCTLNHSNIRPLDSFVRACTEDGIMYECVQLNVVLVPPNIPIWHSAKQL